MGPRDVALELAREVGFDLAGIAPVAPPPAAQRFDDWLAAGHHGSLDYLERNRDRIVDPRGILPQARSMLVLGLAHSRPAFALSDGARVARYAAGRDYHNVMGRMLRKLGRKLEAEGFGAAWRKIVDAGPLLERSHAQAAGLGFESKAANLLHPDFGPWFFLGELLIELELEPTEIAGPALGSCGTCRACIEACPTGAIQQPGVVHAPDCISYQTIENRGSIPRRLRASLGDWAFGCDICSEVCPYGREADDRGTRFGVHPALEDRDLVSWIEAEDFRAHFEGSPLKRPHRAGLARNAALVLGNRPTDRGRRALLHALSFDPAEIVREAAAWGLAQGWGKSAETRGAIEDALQREPEGRVRGDMQRSLEEA